MNQIEVLEGVIASNDSLISELNGIVSGLNDEKTALQAQLAAAQADSTVDAATIAALETTIS